MNYTKEAQIKQNTRSTKINNYINVWHYHKSSGWVKVIDDRFKIHTLELAIFEINELYANQSDSYLKDSLWDVVAHKDFKDISKGSLLIGYESDGNYYHI